MHVDDEAIDAWLGPEELTDKQRDRFIDIWDDATARYPTDDEQDMRNAALSAAVQYILGDTTPEETGRDIGRATAALAETKAAARAVALLAIDDGIDEVALHQQLHVTRRTLRLWLGKQS